LAGHEGSRQQGEKAESARGLDELKIRGRVISREVNLFGKIPRSAAFPGRWFPRKIDDVIGQLRNCKLYSCQFAEALTALVRLARRSNGRNGGEGPCLLLTEWRRCLGPKHRGFVHHFRVCCYTTETLLKKYREWLQAEAPSKWID